MSEESEHRTLAPPNLTTIVDAHTPVESLRLVEQAGIAKSKLGWIDLSIKSFLAGIFISIGAAFDLVVAGGAGGLRASNPSLVTLIAAFTFPIGFVIIILLNVELVTSNMFVMAYSTLRGRTTIYDLARNWVVSYIFNVAGCLFFAGILCYWANTLDSADSQAYAASQASGRVNINWGYNFSRGIMCNWLVAIAFMLATDGREIISKIYGIWIPIWAFVALGYQHVIANYFLIPIGMFYGPNNYGVGKFIWASCIPVTLGNIVGGSVFGALAMWSFYGRHEPSVREMERNTEMEKRNGHV